MPFLSRSLFPSFQQRGDNRPRVSLNQVHSLQLQGRGGTTTSRQHVTADRPLQAQQLAPPERAVTAQQRQGPQQQPNDTHHARHQHEPRHRGGWHQRLTGPGSAPSAGRARGAFLSEVTRSVLSSASRQVLDSGVGEAAVGFSAGKPALWDLPGSCLESLSKKKKKAGCLL